MGYAQFVEITIQNKSDYVVKFQAPEHSWGKFYTDSNKDNEIDPDILNNKTVPAKSDYVLGACGRENASSGCTGSFSLSTTEGVVVAEIAYDSPYGAGQPTLTCASPNASKGWLAALTDLHITPETIDVCKLVIAYIG